MNPTPVSDQCLDRYFRWQETHTTPPSYFVMSHNDMMDLRKEWHHALHVVHSEHKATFCGIEIAYRSSTRNGVELL